MWRGKQDSEGRFCLVFAELKQPGILFVTWEHNKDCAPRTGFCMRSIEKSWSQQVLAFNVRMNKKQLDLFQNITRKINFLISWCWVENSSGPYLGLHPTHILLKWSENP